MKKLSKILSILLVITLVIPGLAFAVNDESVYTVENQKIGEDEKALLESVYEKIKPYQEDRKLDIDIEDYFEDDDEVRIIVELSSNPSIVYATESGKDYSEMSQKSINDIERKIENEQEAVKNKISTQNIKMEYINSFNTVFNGFSGKVKFEDIKLIERISGVKKVYIANEYERPIAEPNMNSSNDMIGSGSTWDIGYEGQGMVIAIIDTGIDPNHKDMVLSEETTPKLTKESVNAIDVPGKYFTDKVPYGYNYYDLNDEILDLGPDASEHGMHVAGTAGANGNPEENGVRGVAPEAQLLAMKVFSNDPIYSTTFSDIYIAAIEDAIKIGIDALNMSLGATASFYVPESAENIAITNAVNHGIVCAVSAGNSAQMTDGWTETYYGYPWKENPDIGVVGSPGLSKDTIQVASIENTNMMTPYLFFEGVEVKEALPANSVIVEDKAYDIRYLNSNPDAQAHLIEAYSSTKAIYIKLNDNVIVDIKGAQVDKNVLPKVVTYYDEKGNISERSPFGESGTPGSNKIPMTVASNVEPAKVLNGMVEFVDCGIGSPDVFEEVEVEGKVAVIIRGGLTFVEKVTNAENAGAVGVIIYNHEDGGEELINMAYPPEGKIPAVFIGHNGGKALLALEEKFVEFSDEVMQVPNANAGKMSSFSSWGTTPSLDLKPEITAPGGQIYSTLQNNKYGMMSGTSMASPHVAGGSALVMQYIKQHPIYKTYSLEEQARLAKVLLMNTAELVLDPYGEEGEPISPRLQGAGLMSLNSAVSTPVRVVNKDTNEAKVELRDFEESNFEMTLKAINDSDKDVTYNVNVDVMTDYIYPISPDVELNLLGARWLAADIEGPETITVPANGCKEFTVKVDFSKDEEKYRNMFVEGFVTLTEATDTHPTLNVPYVGFYGKWDEPAILDGMYLIDEEGKSYFEASGMIYANLFGDAYYYDEVNMSPGTLAGMLFGTGNVIPYLSFMRNAEKVKYNILDKDGNLLRTMYSEDYVYKNYINGGRRGPGRLVFNAAWYGDVNGEVLSDGNYFYEIAAKIHYNDAEWQSKKIPVCIDTTPPEIDKVEYNSETGKLTWEAKDDGSGLLGFLIDINGEGLDDVIMVEEDVNNYEFDLAPYISEDGEYEISVTAIDKAMNMNTGFTTLATDEVIPYIYIMEPELLSVYDTNEIMFKGYVVKNNDLEYVKVNGEEAETVYEEEIEILHPEDPSTVLYRGPGYTFEKTLTLEEGIHQISVEAKSVHGTISSLVRRFYIDTNAPEMTIVEKDREKDSPTAELEINMKDFFPYFKLYQGDNEIYSYDGITREVVLPNGDETITITVNLEEGENVFVFTLVDIAGHETQEEITITRGTVTPKGE